jgi:hypothetical protein
VKTEAIRRYPAQKNVKELLAILGHLVHLGVQLLAEGVRRPILGPSDGIGVARNYAMLCRICTPKIVTRHVMEKHRDTSKVRSL